MGVADGNKGPLDLRNPSHQRWVVKTLTTKGLKGKALFKKMSEYIECDALFDHPDKMHAARLIIWWAACDKPQIPMQDMKWFKPCMRYAKVMKWDKKEAYGDARVYGRVMTVNM